MGRRLQFSLGRLLAVITFVTLLASHVVTSWKLHKARDEMGRMATELGRLTISDPDRLNVVALKTYEDMIWRWRVHVPAGREYAIISATKKIPTDGLPAKHDGVQTVLKSGEYVVTVAVRLGKWKLTIAQETGSISTTISERDAAWLVDSPGYSTTQAGNGATKAAENGQPLVLVRVNSHTKAPASGIPTGPNATTDGILIWVDEWNETPLQPASTGNETATDDAAAFTPVAPILRLEVFVS